MTVSVWSEGLRVAFSSFIPPAPSFLGELVSGSRLKTRKWERAWNGKVLNLVPAVVCARLTADSRWLRAGGLSERQAVVYEGDFQIVSKEIAATPSAWRSHEGDSHITTTCV
jgi:hypothetical protein